MKATSLRNGTLLISLLCLLWHTASYGDESHPGLGLESEYSEAVLAYNKKQTSEAIRILNDILKQKPDHVQALELKALTLKSGGDEREALDTYQRLIKLKPEKERGPYYFEAAVIFNREKKVNEARDYFQRSLALDFNALACHLFLGILEFNAGNIADAEPHFQAVKKEGTPEFQTVAHFYLGLIDFKSGYPSGGSSELIDARDQAKTLPDSSIAKDILTGSEKVLEPFRNGQWFANITLMAQYDSNVSEVPSIDSVPNLVSDARTPKLTLSGGVGHMSSPLNTVQWVPSYRFNYNYNFNSNAKEYSFFTNTGSLYFNYRPLSETTGGLKLEGDFTFQNQPEDPTNLSGSYEYMKYSFTGDIGPYFRTQLTQRTQLELDADYRPQTFYIDNYLSGPDFQLKATVRNDTGSTYFNPGADILLEHDSAQDSDWLYTTVGAGIFDVMHITGKDTATFNLDYSNIDYSSNSAGRKDNTVVIHGSWLHLLANHWALIGDLSYTVNSSTESDEFSYNRYVIGFGISKSI